MDAIICFWGDELDLLALIYMLHPITTDAMIARASLLAATTTVSV